MLSRSRKAAGFFAELRKLSRLWPYIKPYRLLNISALLLVPLVTVIQMLMPIVMYLLIDRGVKLHNSPLITTYAVYYLILAVILYLGQSFQSLLSGMAVQRMIRTLRLTLSRHLLYLPARFHDHNLSGALATRATSDFDSLADSFNKGIINASVDIISLVGSVAGMFLLNWRMALVLAVSLPLVWVIVTLFTRMLKRVLLLARRRLSRLNAYAQECLTGNATVKVLGAERRSSRMYDRYNIEYRDEQMKSVILDSLLYAVIDGFSSVVIGALFWLVLSSLVSVPALTVGLLVAAVAYIKQIFEPLKQLSNKIAMLQGVFTAIDRIFGLLDEDHRIEGEQSVSLVSGEVVFRNVSFHYTGETEKILDNISFTIRPGESLAIVGATGAGKTTIIKLLSKLYDGYVGLITIDGVDLAALNGNALRTGIAFVPQDIALFDGSLRFNIGLGREEYTDAHIEAAALQIGAMDFIRKLPGGLDYRVREQGSNLSQGQRQLIIFSRALVTDPALVILDEATASVDPASEEIIQQATEKLFASRTCIVIAHRLTTIRNCTSILCLEKGRILEQGSHEQLIARRGFYYTLHRAGGE